VGFLLALAPLSGSAQIPVSATASASQPIASESVQQKSYSYLLGPSDVVQIEALNHPDFNVKAPIGADGTIQLPYIGSVSAANMTVPALRERIAQELSSKGVFSNITLVVNVVSYASRFVTVLGGVVAPGLIPIDRTYHLSDVLARAGGVKEGGADYVILRSPSGNEQQISVHDLATGDESTDPVVRPGDKIFIPTAVFYIKGQVKAPGAYPVSLNMTLAMALARGSGLTDIGSDHHIKVTRNGVVLDAGDLNFKVQPNDVIDVGESWF
jgi:polysaccharide export outer membrane protein